MSNTAAAVLDRETAHLHTAEREAVAACLCYAAALVASTEAFRRIGPAAAVEAVAGKLLTMPGALPRWARVLVAKAALEAPEPVGSPYALQGLWVAACAVCAVHDLPALAA